MERGGRYRREGKRVFGANCNPITGLVKRHADHKNSSEVMWGLSRIYRACPEKGRERKYNRFAHILIR